MTLREHIDAWVAAAREQEGFVVFTTVFLIVLTIAVLAMHGADYAANIHNGVAFGGAVVGVFVSAVACTVLALLYPRWPRKKWIAAAVAGGLIFLFFALLPPLTAGRGWLTVLLFVLITAAYDALVVIYALVMRPWRWMPGFGT